MAIITDPDQLNQGIEVTITTGTKKITLAVAGNLSTDGVTLKCLYSFLKEEWKNDVNLIKFPFPMQPITDEQFELVNGWDFFNNTSRYLIRNGGWALKDNSGVSQEEWAGVVTLGEIGGSTVPGSGTDQVYFQQSTGAATNIQRTGAVNQAIQIYGDATHGNFDFRNSLTLFVRAQGKTFDSATNTEIGAATMTYQVYRFPLSNGTDLKVNTTDANIIGNTPFFGASVKNAADGAATSGSATFTSASVTFAAGDVGRYLCIDTGANAGVYRITTFNSATSVDVERNMPATLGSITFSVNPAGMSITWYGSPQVRSIGGINRDFHVIINGNNGTLEQIYQFVQFQLRQNADIDWGAGTKTGLTTNELLFFVGDTLKAKLDTTGGVYIDNFLAGDTNRVTMIDDLGVERTFPFVAVLTLQFGSNLINDAQAIYRVYFTNANGNQFGTTNAIIVDDDATVDMAGNISAQSSIQHTFAYDSNVQGGRTSGTDAPVTVVAIGLGTAQYVSATGTIARSTANVISLVASLERNYTNP